jgi:hypothetical protein
MDLNREVAEKVMGWKDMGYWADGYGHAYSINAVAGPDVFCIAHIEDTQCSCEIWNPLEDLNQCFEVVEKIGDCLHLSEHGKEGRWAAQFCGCSMEWSHGDTPNIAILKAALAARQWGE